MSCLCHVSSAINVHLQVRPCVGCRLHTAATQRLVLEGRTIPKHHASPAKIGGQGGLDFGGRCDMLRNPFYSSPHL